MAVPTVDILCQQAQLAIKQRDWEKARQAYLQALGLKSDSPDIHSGLATVCFQLRDLTSAAHHFKEVTRLDPLRAGAFVNLGAVYNLLGQYDEAVTALRRGIQLDSHRSEGYYNLGLVYKRKGQLDLAIQAYREALRINPRMSDGHYNLANLYLEKGRYRQAVDHYSLAVQLRPGWDRALQGLEQARVALAEEEAQLATERHPDETPPPTVVPLAPSAAPELQRMLHPDRDGQILNFLHKTTIESETQSLAFLKLLQEEIEPTLKELSSSLLQTTGSHGDLDLCVRKFETALSHFRTAQQNLHSTIARLRSISDQLAKN